MTSYCFQNPNDGHPMVLLGYGSAARVELVECDQCDPHEGCRAAFDARAMNDALRDLRITNTDKAAYYLYHQHGCTDIFD